MRMRWLCRKFRTNSRNWRNKVVKEGKRYRGLNPWQDENYRLLTFLAKGENATNGFRNHDLRQ
jgi:hypothetical protein